MEGARVAEPYRYHWNATRSTRYMASWKPEELQYHIRCTKGDVGRYVLLPGDPGRVPKIAAYLTDAKQVAHNRE